METNILADILENITVVDDSEIERIENEQKQKEKEERKSRLEYNYREKSNIPPKYWDVSLASYHPENIENERVYNWILNYTDAVKNKANKKNLIVLTGNNGTGKTHLTCAMIRELGGYMINSLELCIEYDSCRDFRAKETRIEYLKRICNYKVLVIDELGKGIEKIEKEIMPYIFNSYYGDGSKVLVCTGNETRERITDLIGIASLDRMNESGVFLTLTGESFRKKK